MCEWLADSPLPVRSVRSHRWVELTAVGCLGPFDQVMMRAVVDAVSDLDARALVISEWPEVTDDPIRIRLLGPSPNVVRLPDPPATIVRPPTPEAMICLRALRRLGGHATLNQIADRADMSPADAYKAIESLECIGRVRVGGERLGVRTWALVG